MSPIHQGTTDVAINYGVQAAAPTSPSPTEGSEYWHKTNNKRYLHDGSNWSSVDVTGPYSGGTSTHWWTQAGLSDNDGWTATKGSKDLTRYDDDELIYTASDSDFNNNIVKLGEKFCQDSVLLIPQGGDGAFLLGTNESWPGLGEKEPVGAFAGGKEAEFMSRVKGRPFVFKEIHKQETWDQLGVNARYTVSKIAERVLNENR